MKFQTSDIVWHHSKPADVIDLIAEMEARQADTEEIHKLSQHGDLLCNAIENMLTVKEHLKMYCLSETGLGIYNSEGELDAALGMARTTAATLEGMNETEIELLTRKYESACENWLTDKIKDFIEWVKKILKKIKDWFVDTFTGRKEEEQVKQTEEAVKAINSVPKPIMDKVDLNVICKVKTADWTSKALNYITYSREYINCSDKLVAYLLEGNFNGVKLYADQLTTKSEKFLLLAGIKLGIKIDQKTDGNVEVAFGTEPDLSFLKSGDAEGKTVKEAGYGSTQEIGKLYLELLNQIRLVTGSMMKKSNEMSKSITDFIEKAGKSDEFSAEDFRRLSNNAKLATKTVSYLYSVADKLNNLKEKVIYRMLAHSHLNEVYSKLEKEFPDKKEIIELNKKLNNLGILKG